MRLLRLALLESFICPMSLQGFRDDPPLWVGGLSTNHTLSPLYSTIPLNVILLPQVSGGAEIGRGYTLNVGDYLFVYSNSEVTRAIHASDFATDFHMCCLLSFPPFGYCSSITVDDR